jgi:hypothetical protein
MHSDATYWTDLTARWEAEAERVRDVTSGSVRVAYLRTGLVLGIHAHSPSGMERSSASRICRALCYAGKRGGAFQQMALPFSLGLGSPFGAGRQVHHAAPFRVQTLCVSRLPLRRILHSLSLGFTSTIWSLCTSQRWTTPGMLLFLHRSDLHASCNP